MAWLNARAAGESQTQNFLNAIVTHAMINEQKTEGARYPMRTSSNFMSSVSNLVN